MKDRYFRPMDHHEYRGLLADLELTQVHASRMLHIADRSSRNYALGLRDIHGPMAGVLRLMRKYRLEPDDVADVVKANGGDLFSALIELMEKNDVSPRKLAAM